MDCERIARNCPQCGSAQHSAVPGYGRDGWTTVACDDCDFVFLSHAPRYEALSETLAWSKQFAIEKKARRQRSPVVSWIDEKTRWRLHIARENEWDYIAEKVPQGRVLDVGCGAMNRVPDRFVPYGIEIEKAAAEVADSLMRERGGAVVERAKFGAFLLFTALWSILVYSVVSCWVWNADGWLFKLGALDFAGGTVVHVASGFAALGLCIALGTRKHPGAQPHNTTLTLLGAGLLWFGWFGFNAGSAYAINGIAINAFLVTHVAAAAGMCAWMLVEYLAERRVTAVGAASGLIAGLVGITPAAGFVGVMGSLAIGGVVGAACFYGIRLKHRLGYDDALDVVGIHGLGGVIGSLLTGVFASAAINPIVAESLKDGRLALLGKQALGVVVVGAFSLVASWLLAKAIDRTLGLRVDEAEEAAGLDVVTHGESGYALIDDLAPLGLDAEPSATVR